MSLFFVIYALLASSFSYADSNTFLLSYPRSGNTWTRYCIEHIAHRTTHDQVPGRKILREPLSKYTGNILDESKNPVLKVHKRGEVLELNGDPTQDKLILIIRNPKETCLQLKTPISEQFGYISYFFDNIALFDEWQEDHRLLLFYEDLIANPTATLKKLMEFLGDDPADVDEFIDHIETHKNTSYDFYDEKGLGCRHFSVDESVPLSIAREFDARAQEQFSYLWFTYLHDRYAS